MVTKATSVRILRNMHAGPKMNSQQLFSQCVDNLLLGMFCYNHPKKLIKDVALRQHRSL